ncbi:MAG: hypothetical protein CL899_00735, partial [Dehalococcoidia bacterium]|nr:hypothetical protein [Dehalococcoidia bacterium]
RLDLEITSDLRNEGIVRDIIRAVQNVRREKRLDVSDHIDLKIVKNDELSLVIKPYEEFIRNQVLAKSITFGEIRKLDFEDIIQELDVGFLISKSD